jgi:hypothetical protein
MERQGRDIDIWDRKMDRWVEIGTGITNYKGQKFFILVFYFVLVDQTINITLSIHLT